jgi:hypothetical protein
VIGLTPNTLLNTRTPVPEQSLAFARLYYFASFQYHYTIRHLPHQVQVMANEKHGLVKAFLTVYQQV